MKPIVEELAPAGIGLNDIMFIVFRHKWKILLCTLAGLAGAATLYFVTAREYESRAKLLVRYVIERSAVDSLDPKVNTSGSQNGAIINSEIEILTSLDLALQVVETIGVKRLTPKANPITGKGEAVNSIFRGLRVVPPNGSSVITVGYRNRDPELARAVLDELIKQYFEKHLEVHRSNGASKFVTEQAQVTRSRLRLTQDDLQKRKAEAGIFSLADSTASINLQLARTEQALQLAETEWAVQQVRVNELETLLPGGVAGQSKPTKEEEGAPSVPRSPGFRNATANPRPDAKEGEPLASADQTEIQRYRLVLEQLAQLRKTEMELLSKFTAESQFVTSIRRQIEPLENQRREFVKKFPELFAVGSSPVSDGRTQPDIVTEKTNLAALAAKVESLKTQLRTAQEQAARLAQVGPLIAELERKVEVEEGNLKYMESGLEKARVDEALDSTKIPNINIVQRPSTGARVSSEMQKPLLGLAGGGLGLGLGLALFIELVLNRGIRRPSELETRLRIPQLVSIPYFPSAFSSHRRLKKGADDSGDDTDKDLEKPARPAIASWAPDHFIRTFADEVRDRLILSFRLKSLTHKPKLIGVAGVSGGEGTSTLAGSLAASLSETGDGKVLLVDMNLRTSAAHPFQDGKPACGLAEALESSGSLPPTSENLYVATGSSGNGGLIQLAAKRFYALVPDLKASHFDYIIFDLPPVCQGSATLAIAGCLDKLLFVVEAEKSDRHEVKRAYDDLVAAKADVAGILNKTRTSGPRWLNA